MTTIPTALSDLADRLEKFTPTPAPREDDGEYWTLDLQLAAALLGYDKAIHDALQLYESVEFASEFKERCERLYELAGSNDLNKVIANFPSLISELARYCRSLATAIECKFRANPPVWNVSKMLAGRQSAAGEQPAVIQQPPEVAEASDAQVEQGHTGTEAARPPANWPFDQLVDPVTCVWVVRQIGKAAGRSDTLAAKMKRRRYPIVKHGGLLHCQRKDAITMFPRFKQRLVEINDAEA